MPLCRAFSVLCILLAWAAATLSFGSDAGAAERLGLQSRLTEIYRAHRSAVVRVKVVTEKLDSSGKPTRWVSSGFFIDRKGRVLTNLATTDTPTRVWIEADRLPFLAEMVGFDPETGLALLQVVKLPPRFEVIGLEESPETLPVGSLALAITSPLEFDPTPFLGLVAGYESQFSSFRFPFTYMRVTIPAGPGENGSPVLDLEGRLAGISVASLPDVRSSYLVPARAVRRIVQDLEELGRVAYADLPIRFAERPDAQKLERLVVVDYVSPDSSASRADVRVGDIVRQLGSVTVRSLNDIRDALFYSHPGQFISLEVERDGRRIPFALPLEEKTALHPPPPPPAAPEAEKRQPDQNPPPPGLSPPTRPQTG